MATSAVMMAAGVGQAQRFSGGLRGMKASYNVCNANSGSPSCSACDYRFIQRSPTLEVCGSDAGHLCRNRGFARTGPAIAYYTACLLFITGYQEAICLLNILLVARVSPEGHAPAASYALLQRHNTVPYFD